jgi:formylglycine-generating enzyme required for sulfatase activity
MPGNAECGIRIFEPQFFRMTKNTPFIPDHMVEIPKGRIELRDDRTKEKWAVDIEAFWLSRFPVTQEIYFEITHENPGTYKGDLHPVETVSFKDAVIFCNKLSAQNGLALCYEIQEEGEEIIFHKSANGFRLPTEAEWEYACKAGTAGIRYGELDLIAWYKDNSGNKTQRVGQKMPNPWGLYDMLGNVWEWCNDLYDTDVYGSYRIFRGGGFCDTARSVMATTRRRSHPVKFKIDDLGFRIAKNKQQ